MISYQLSVGKLTVISIQYSVFRRLLLFILPTSHFIIHNS
ncbi:hypothetical protein MICAK_280010 [Microcystis aeruginosa PCC 9701]|uniref:Uncharacterized protein n=1 Tax=Microcystis aeruginosa PCC 9701 TaxID=721123 RepID=I4IRK6_MICAE|nr:hypothetical protein MICAK_280010 [Microcystis aeruginosa PCC 9701]